MLVGESGNPKASIVIPAYNSRYTIAKCLGALMRQDTDLAYEIIVVESSGDGAGDIIREQFPGVQLIEPGRRTFAGAARNLGAETASGELLLFIDSDCVAERKWLAKMWRAHQKWDCSSVSGSIENANPETSVSVAGYMNEHSDYFPYGKPRYVDYSPSGNVSYKTPVFRKYGGFDANAMLYEDLMFGRMLSRSGEKLLFDPDIRVAHFQRSTLKEYLAHEYLRGRSVVTARRRGLLIGSSWVKYPILAFAVVPGLFMRKAAVFPFRLFRAYPAWVLSLLRSLPYLYLAMVVWHYGFLAEVVASRGSGKAGGEVAECRTS